MAKNDKPNMTPGDIVEAIGLLTRLPVTSDGARGATAGWAWPIAGAVVGFLSAIAGALCLWFSLPVGVAAGVALACQIMLTGAMHEDGLADCADGFWGGFEPERRLEIMADSRIGTYGVLALILSILLQWGLLKTFFAEGNVIAPMIVAGALSRVPMLALMHAMEPARPGGLSDKVGCPHMDTVILTGVCALLIALVFTGFASLWAAILVGATALGIRHLAIAKIGGQTGDVLGASQQVAQIAALIGLLSMIG